MVPSAAKPRPRRAEIATNPGLRRALGPRVLRSLDTKKLLPEDFIVLRGKQAVLHPSPYFGIYRELRLSYCMGSTPPRRQQRYPEGTQGFFYWYIDPNAPLLAGQLRFRVTDREHPASFSAGKDLCLPTGEPWTLPLIAIASGENYTLLRYILLLERLVTKDVMGKAAAAAGIVSPRTSIGPMVHSHFVWRFRQPFRIKLEARRVRIWVTGPSGIVPVTFHNLFRSYWAEMPPYEGTALVQFERSPFLEHAGTRTVVLRIVKLAGIRKTHGDWSPVQEPEEGELVRKSGAFWLPLFVDVDESHPQQECTKALQLLFENEGISKST
ncbi:hypothetical protein OE88DRAFT_1738195 [Heliocybe sulcata]|uniref:Uncharacterized protein n=1 Tax=Heliocybe sulcata TaxID=5364 RepID=A0A5C3MUD6_9AGAM|nr:hypothetical protein OE88DRAFT_1738195 [Heliocybe sulcata]